MRKTLHLNRSHPNHLVAFLCVIIVTGCSNFAPSPTSPAIEASHTATSAKTASLAPIFTALPTITPSKTPTQSPTAPPTSTPKPTPIPFVGEWQCWDDGSPDPCHRNLNAISMLTNKEGWMVGERGAILHWDGKQWKAVERPVIANLYFVKAVAPDEAWAAGRLSYQDDSFLLHWNGEEWSVFSYPPTRASFDAMSFVDKNYGWAIVHDSTPEKRSYFLKWDGKTWTSITGSLPLFGLGMLSENDGWAVGASSFVYHWDGKTWEKYHHSINGGNLESLSVVSASDIWATGRNRLVLHWNGSEWDELLLENLIPLQIAMASSKDGWLIVGDGTITFKLMRWDGKAWKVFKGQQPELTDGMEIKMEALPNGEVWLIKAHRREVWHWDGVSWKLYELGGYPRMKAFEFVSPTEAWAVGEGGYIAFWDRKDWKPIRRATAGQQLNDVTFLAPDNGWAVGDGSQILHWDGRRWEEVRKFRPQLGGPSLDFSHLNGVAFLNPDYGWVVGGVSTEGGGYPFMLHWDGQSWQEVDRSLFPENCRCSLTSIGLVNQTSGWAVGGHEGNLLYWNGVEWQSVENPANYWLLSIDILSSSNIWAVGMESGAGYPGIIIHWDGSEWKKVMSTLAWLDVIVMLSENDGWAAGSSGFTYHWDGQSWQVQDSPILSQIVDLEVSPTGQIWALAENGVLLFWEKR